MDAHLHENDEVTERLSGGDPVLSILYRGAYIKIWNEEFHVWGAEIDVPPDVARWLVGSGGVEHELKSRFAPRIGDHKVGYVDEVKRDHEATRGEDGADVPPTTLVVKTATNFQPMVEVQALVDDLWEHAEESEEAAANAEAAFEAAKENLGE